ncbi:MAG: hypothetical protein AB1458_11820 [Bacteroidota bacterium]
MQWLSRAISLLPASFNCDAKGKIVLALFTPVKNFYLLNSTGFDKMNISEGMAYNFQMKDMSNEIKAARIWRIT